ncbi:MAG TPA: SAM-dependent methyltransferase [Pseudonocardia sp.]
MRSDGLSADVEYDRPSAARVYDYYLGGSHNFAVDREMARAAIAMWPELPQIMQANRAFLRRAVEFLVGQGITQFLDIGSGIPTVGNVHEVAQAAEPDARVVYVDIDPVAVAHSREILAGDERTAVVHADFLDVDAVLGSAEVARLLDLSQPVGVLLVALLHFVPVDADPAAAVARYRDTMAAGSYLVVSHATQEGQPRRADEHQALYRRTSTPMTMRSRAEVAALFTGFDLVAPGVVFLPQWRPDRDEVVDDRPERFTGLAAVGRKN